MLRFIGFAVVAGAIGLGVLVFTGHANTPKVDVSLTPKGHVAVQQGVDSARSVAGQGLQSLGQKVQGQK